MKLLGSLALSVVAAQGKWFEPGEKWVQPSYWDAVHSSQTRGDPWGFPVGLRAAALWSSCPTLTTPANAEPIGASTCQGATCMVKCKPGFQAQGRRRVRCRWKQKHGFFWRNQLSDCTTCEGDPASGTMTGSGVITTCETNALKGRKVCVSTCPTGQKFGNGKTAIKSKCKCKKNNPCAWLIRGAFNSFSELSCTGTSVTTNSDGLVIAGPGDTSGTGGSSDSGSDSTGGSSDSGSDSTGGSSDSGSDSTGGSSDGSSGSGSTGGDSGSSGSSDGDSTGGDTSGGSDSGNTDGASDGSDSGSSGSETATQTAQSNADCQTAISSLEHKTEICAMVDHVNTLRAQHGADPVRVSADLCTTAQAMADELAKQNGANGAIEHNHSQLDTLKEGENLYSIWDSSNPTVNTVMTKATDAWQAEKDWWTHGDVPGKQVGGSQADNCQSGKMCGHYTAQVWKATKNICYGYAKGPDGWAYVVARYKEAGNMIGAYTTNVSPATSSK